MAAVGALELAWGNTVFGVVILALTLGAARSILALKRIADRAPTVPPPTEEQLIQSRRRARRFFVIGAPTMVVLGAALGLLVGGVGGAIWMAASLSVIVGPAGWLAARRLRD